MVTLPELRSTLLAFSALERRLRERGREGWRLFSGRKRGVITDEYTISGGEGMEDTEKLLQKKKSFMDFGYRHFPKV